MPPNETDKIEAFLRILVTGTKDQRLAILRFITPQQVTIIRQVSYNILINSSIYIGIEDRDYLNRNISAVRQLASRRVELEQKREILIKRHLLVKKLAQIALDYLQ